MLAAEHPELDEATRKELAHRGALQSLKIAQHEQATGDHAVLVCKCGHTDRVNGADPGHMFSSGVCKNAGCECLEFVAERVHTNAQ